MSSGGFEILSRGGSANATTVDSGGLLINLGGSATDTVELGGVVVASAVLVFQTNGSITVEPDPAHRPAHKRRCDRVCPVGRRRERQHHRFRWQRGHCRRHRHGGVVNTGGRQFIYSGGLVENGTVSGQEYVYSGGMISGGTIAASGGVTVYAGGTISGGVESGAITVSAGGLAIGVTVSGGTLVNSGTTSGLVIDAGLVEQNDGVSIGRNPERRTNLFMPAP